MNFVYVLDIWQRKLNFSNYDIVFSLSVLTKHVIEAITPWLFEKTCYEFSGHTAISIKKQLPLSMLVLKDDHALLSTPLIPYILSSNKFQIDETPKNVSFLLIIRINGKVKQENTSLAKYLITIKREFQRNLRSHKNNCDNLKNCQGVESL